MRKQHIVFSRPKQRFVEFLALFSQMFFFIHLEYIQFGIIKAFFLTVSGATGKEEVTGASEVNLYHIMKTFC